MTAQDASREIVRTSPARPPTRCRHPECPKVAINRGVCLKHYQLAARLVREGRTTWPILEAWAKVLPSTGTGTRNLKQGLWFLTPP